MDRSKLSSESNRFIEKLRLYLFSQGIEQSDIEEVADNLAQKLYEMEQNNEPIEPITEQSPQEYLDELKKAVNETKNPSLSWLIPYLLIGAIVFMVFGDVLRGVLYGEIVAYSLFRIGSTVVIGVLFILGALLAVRYTSKNEVTGTKEYQIFAIPAVISMLLFIAAYIMDGYVETSLVTVQFTGNIILLGIGTVIAILLSIWAKTWILPVILIAWNFPPLILENTPLGVNMQAFLGIVLTVLIVGAYIYLEFQEEK
ncbi:HAAS domain-containing protein [Oceanobacillus locisalsi]|uniref:HAAS domain-containing protein n=1 Tax=Oceanobacillus locisalsi TaxID=546107 RepID=A0ABW3NDW8_9BACI